MVQIWNKTTTNINTCNKWVCKIRKFAVVKRWNLIRLIKYQQNSGINQKQFCFQTVQTHVLEIYVKSFNVVGCWQNLHWKENDYIGIWHRFNARLETYNWFCSFHFYKDSIYWKMSAFECCIRPRSLSFMYDVFPSQVNDVGSFGLKKLFLFRQHLF